MPEIEWRSLALSLGTFQNEYPGMEVGGDDYGRAALTLIVGPDSLESAVDYYVEGNPGAELARSVLMVLRPRIAVERCLYLYAHSVHLETRRAAVELLRSIADASMLPWVTTFLNDPDPGIQNWGISLLDQLVVKFSLTWDDVSSYLQNAESHVNPDVRRLAQDIVKVLYRSR